MFSELDWFDVNEKLPPTKAFVSVIVIVSSEDETFPAYLHENGWFYEVSNSDHGNRMFRTKGAKLGGMFSTPADHLKLPMAEHWAYFPKRLS
jgi:hypothetical protein